MNARPLPASLVDNPRLDRWIHFQPDRTVRIATGKVEMGQGVVTAIGQIAAEELDLPLDRVVVLSGDTDQRPGRALHDVVARRSKCRAARCAWSAPRCGPRRWSAPRCASTAAATISPWSTASSCRTVRRPGRTTGLSPARSTSPRRPPARAPVKPARPTAWSASSVPRIDLPAKLSGAAFVHDVLPKDVLHARTLRQPNRGATLAALDEAAIRRAAAHHHVGGELQIIREANFVAFVSPVESVAQAAAAAAPAHAKWDNARRLEPAQQEAAWLKGQPSDDRRIGAWPAPATAAQPPRADDRLAALHRARLDVAVVRAGRVPRRPPDGALARPGHASVAQEPRCRCSACRSRRSPRSTCMARAATATTAPTMRPSTPRWSPCAFPAAGSACNGAARRSSASSRSALPCW